MNSLALDYPPEEPSGIACDAWFTPIPHSIASRTDLAPGAKIIMGIVIRDALQTGVCHTTKIVIARQVGLSTKQVNRHLNTLLSTGLVAKQHSGLIALIGWKQRGGKRTIDAWFTPIPHSIASRTDLAPGAKIIMGILIEGRTPSGHTMGALVGLSRSQVSRHLATLEEAGFIKIVRLGQGLGNKVTVLEFQPQEPKEGDDMAATIHQLPLPGVPEQPNPPLSEPEDHWEDFWDAYPRKVGMGAAKRAWTAALKRATPEEIMAGLYRTRFSVNREFIPHPSTWLNGQRWNDEDDYEPDGHRYFRIESPTEKYMRLIKEREIAEDLAVLHAKFALEDEALSARVREAISGGRSQ